MYHHAIRAALPDLPLMLPDPVGSRYLVEKSRDWSARPPDPASIIPMGLATLLLHTYLVQTFVNSLECLIFFNF